MASIANTINTALIGLQVSLEQFQRASAHIADPNSETDLVRDIIELKSAEQSYKANAAVVRSADELAGITIDILIR